MGSATRFGTAGLGIAVICSVSFNSSAQIPFYEPTPMPAEHTYVDPHIEEALFAAAWEKMVAQYGKDFTYEYFFGNCESAMIQPADLIVGGFLLSKAISTFGRALLTRKATQALAMVAAEKVEMETVHGLTQRAIVEAFQARGVSAKFIEAFERNFKGFLKMEEWDAMELDVWAVAATKPGTGEIFLRAEAFWYNGLDNAIERNILKAALEESVHSQRIAGGLFKMENLIAEEARAKIIVSKAFGDWPADKAALLKELENYRRHFKNVARLSGSTN